MVDVREPWVIKDFWSDDKHKKVLSSINAFDKSVWSFDKICNRYTVQNEYLNKLSMLELDRAREQFNNDKLLHTYSLLSLYNQENSRLEAHKDNNACTYTFDVCLYADKPWPITIEGKDYVAGANETVCFYGEDQLHWRPQFSPGNKVLVLFMHFADRDHWWFQSGLIGDSRR